MTKMDGERKGGMMKLSWEHVLASSLRNTQTVQVLIITQKKK